jgi:hypothetical protein
MIVELSGCCTEDPRPAKKQRPEDCPEARRESQREKGEPEGHRAVREEIALAEALRDQACGNLERGHRRAVRAANQPDLASESPKLCASSGSST